VAAGVGLGYLLAGGEASGEAVSPVMDDEDDEEGIEDAESDWEVDVPTRGRVGGESLAIGLIAGMFLARLFSPVPWIVRQVQKSPCGGSGPQMAAARVDNNKGKLTPTLIEPIALKPIAKDDDDGPNTVSNQ